MLRSPAAKGYFFDSRRHVSTFDFGAPVDPARLRRRGSATRLAETLEGSRGSDFARRLRDASPPSGDASSARMSWPSVAGLFDAANPFADGGAPHFRVGMVIARVSRAPVPLPRPPPERPSIESLRPVPTPMRSFRGSYFFVGAQTIVLAQFMLTHAQVCIRVRTMNPSNT